jgi:methionyl-tRNA formyltransferase
MPLTKVLYLGLDLDAIPLLNQSEKIKIEAVARIPALHKTKTKNPVDGLFRTAYHAQFLGQNQKARKYLSLFKKYQGFSSGFFRTHSPYIDFIITNDIHILKTSDPEFEDKVRQLDIKLFLVNVWEMLPKEVVEIPSLGCINIHPSALPKYRGALPLVWALKNREKSSAITYMTLDHTMDGGGILKQYEFEILQDDTPFTLDTKVKRLIQNTIVQTVEDYVDGNLKPQVQDLSKSSKTAKYESYKKIEFAAESAKDILNKIMHYAHYDLDSCSYFEIRNSKIKVVSCRGIAPEEQIQPGSALFRFPFMYIGCQDATLKFHYFKDLNGKSLLTLIMAKKFKVLRTGREQALVF